MDRIVDVSMCSLSQDAKLVQSIDRGFSNALSIVHASQHQGNGGNRY